MGTGEGKGMDRRGFLKLAGLGVLGAAGLPAKVPNPAYPTRMKGVVEKCTFCSERLDRGEMPACVEACTEKLLAFGDLQDAAAPVRALLKEHFTIRRKPNLGTQPQVYYIV